MINDVLDIPNHIRDALWRVDSAQLKSRPSHGFVVCGMGGSAIGAELARGLIGLRLTAPMVVVRSYNLPKWINHDWAVLASSYSGDTEETLSMAESAAQKGAHVVSVSCGGALESLARDAGGMHVPCPTGLLPRAAVGALVAPVAAVLYKLGLAPGAHALLMRAQEQLARRRDACRPEVTGAANPARELARQIGRTIPLIYGGGALGAVAAYRWKCDVNENAKAPAFWNTYPELDHNEICAWGQHGDVTRQLLTVVEVRHGFEHDRLRLRFDATRTIIDECVHQVLSVEAQGEGRLAQLLDLMYVGDWTGCYLALDNDVDPGPIDAINDLKSRLQTN